MLGPENAHSPNAEDLNALYWVMMVIGLLLIVAINAALIGLVVRFRGTRGAEPRRLRSRRRFQVMAASGLTALAVVVFVLGVIFTEDAREVEASGPDGLQASSLLTAQRDIKPPSGDSEPLTIQASGQQWIWRYEYPQDNTFSYYELVVPVDTTVVVELDSTDVVHRWWVPGLGGKFDVVPDQESRTWFKADEEGVYYGASYQFSGAAYAAMRTRVRVVTPTEYEAWLEQQSADIQEAQELVQRELDARVDSPDNPPGNAASEDVESSAPGGGGGSSQ